MATKVGNFVVKNVETAQDIVLSSFWKAQPCILYFLGRFGCQMCRWQSNQVSKLATNLKGRNVRFVAVSPERLGWEDYLKGKFWVGSDVYYDPEKKLYQELELKRTDLLRTIGGLFKKETWDMIGKTRSAGGNFKGDAYQLGGVFVVSEGGGNILYEFRQNHYTDSPDVQAIAKSLGIEYTPTAEAQPTCNSDSCTVPEGNASKPISSTAEQKKVDTVSGQ